MSDVMASGPLWTMSEWMQDSCAVATEDRGALPREDGIIPCRMIEGHGKVVPVELVEEIRKEMAALTRKMFDGDHTEGDVAAVHMAIDKAIDWAV